jgi:hypothetical protein
MILKHQNIVIVRRQLERLLTDSSTIHIITRPNARLPDLITQCHVKVHVRSFNCNSNSNCNHPTRTGSPSSSVISKDPPTFDDLGVSESVNDTRTLADVRFHAFDWLQLKRDSSTLTCRCTPMASKPWGTGKTWRCTLWIAPMRASATVFVLVCPQSYEMNMRHGRTLRQ